MRTTNNDPSKVPQTTSITVIEEPLPKEEFEFRSQTKIERALKTLQRLSALTTLLSTYQLVPMTLSLFNNPSSFNLVSTSLAGISLILSLALAFWSTKVLKSEQNRHFLSQELPWEGVNTGLFVTLLIRAALSLVLIPNMLFQSELPQTSGLTDTINNLAVPLPLIELMVFFVFISAAKTTFTHIKQSGRAMSSLIFFSNIAMLGSALALVYSVLRLKAFPFQGDFALLFPSWNMNGLLRLGAIASVMAFLVWVVNYKRWRVPSVFCTIIVGALVLGFATLSISGYSNAHSVEREHGAEFARPFLSFSNLGMLAAVFGSLVFVGGTYFWRRHYNFIETNKKRNLAGFVVLFSLVMVFVTLRGVYWQPFATENRYSSTTTTKTYSPFQANYGSQMTIKEAMLTKYLLNDLDSIDQGLKDTARGLSNVITLFENTKRRGFFPTELTTQLWSFTDSVEEAEQYVPKEAAMELFALFGGVDNLQHQLSDAADGLAENTLALKNYAVQLWPWSQSLPEESEDYKSILPNNSLVTKLWGLFGSMNKVQDSIEDTKLQIASTKVAYKQAQATARDVKEDAEATTEFWPWSHKLNTYENYTNLVPEEGVTQLWWIFRKAAVLHTQLKDASQRIRGVKKDAENATTALWPSRAAALADFRNFVPMEQQLQLFSLFGSANDVETSLDNVNEQLDYAQGVYTDAQDKGLVPPPKEETKLWSAWANSQRNYPKHAEVAKNASIALWSFFGSVNKSEQALSDASIKAAEARNSIKDAQNQGLLPTEKTVEAWSSHWQDSLPQRFMTQTWTSGWETTQLWGDHWSVVDKTPESGLKFKVTQAWDAQWGEEFPREAATKLFSLFSRVNSLENSINNAKDNVEHTKDQLNNAQAQGVFASTENLSEEQLTAFWSLFGSAKKLKNTVNTANHEINDAQAQGLVAPQTELWPWSDSLNEYDGYKEALPQIALSEFWSLFGSSTADLEESLVDSQKQIQEAQSQGLIPTPETTWLKQVPEDVSTQLFSLASSLSSAQSSLNQASNKLSNAKSLYQNAQNLGVVSKTSSGTQATTSSKDVSGSLNNIQNQLNTANQKLSNIQNVYNNAQNLGLVAKPGAATPTELYSLPGSLNSVQSSLNSASQKLNNVQNIYSNAQNIGLATKQASSQGYLSDAQSQLNTANQKLNNMQNIYSNAQNLGLVPKQGATVSEFWSLSDSLDKADKYIPKTTELWSLFGWFSSAQEKVNTANQKLNDVKNIYTNAQNLGLIAKENAAATNTANDGKTTTQLWTKNVENFEKYKAYLPAEVVTEFWSLFSSVSDAQDNVAHATNQIQEAQEKGVIPSAETAETWSADWTEQVPRESFTQLWSLFSWFSSAQTSLNTANQKITDVKNIYTNAQNLGLITKENAAAAKTDNTAPATATNPSLIQLWSLWGSLNDASASLNAANQKLQTVQNIQQNAKNLGLIGDQSNTGTSTENKSVLGGLAEANSKLQSVASIQQSAKNLGLIDDKKVSTSSEPKSVMDSLNDANQKLQSISNIQQSAKNLGLIKDQNPTASGTSTPTTTATTTATPTAQQSKSLFSALTDAQSSLNTANQKLSQVQSIYQNAQNLGLVSKTGAAASNKLWTLSNSLTSVQNQLNAVNRNVNSAKNIYTSAQNIGLVSKQNAAAASKAKTEAESEVDTTELWSVSNTLDKADHYIPKLWSVSDGLDKADHYIPKLWSVSEGLDKADHYIPKTMELWSLWGWLTNAQTQVNTANQKLANVQNIVQNAQNLGLVNKETPAPTELWSLWGWLTNAQTSLNTANQKLASAQNLVQNAQNLGLIGKSGTTATPSTTETAATPSNAAQITELWSLWNWLTGAQSSLNTANQKLTEVKNIYQNAQNLGLVTKENAAKTDTQTDNNNAAAGTTTPTPTELWSLWGWLTNAQTSLNTANQKVNDMKNIYTNAQNLGLINKQGTTTTTAGTTETVPPSTDAQTTELWSLFGWFSSAQSSINTANQKINDVKNIYQNAQNLGLVSKENANANANTNANNAAATPTPTELWSLWGWLTNAQTSLNTANQKLTDAKNLVQNAQNLGLIGKEGTTTTTTTAGSTTETAATPSDAKTTELWSLWNWLTGAQEKVNAANQKLTEVKNIYQNAQNLGLVTKENAAKTDNNAATAADTTTTTATPSELWSLSDSLDKADKYIPKTMELWSLWGWLTNAQTSLNTANQKITDAKNLVQNAQNLGLIGKEGTTTTTGTTEATPSTTAQPTPTELWSLFGWLTDAQTSLNNANQKITNAKNIYQNAQNLGLVAKENAQTGTTTPPTTGQPTELWSLWNWLTGAQSSLNTANQKINDVKNIYQNAQNLGLVTKENAAAGTDTTTATPPASDAAASNKLWKWSSSLEEDDASQIKIPQSILAELWGIFGSLSDLENSAKDATQQIEDARAEFENAQNQKQETLTPEAEIKLWSLFGKLSNVDTSIENATHTIQDAQNRGVIPTPETVDAWDSEWLDKVPKEVASELWGLFGSLNNLDHSLSDTKDQLQDVGVTYQGAQEKGLVGKEGELTRLFWPFTKSKPKTIEDKAKEALESAKSSLSSAGATVQDKAKSAYASAKTSAEELSQKASETAKNLADKAKTAYADSDEAYHTGQAAAKDAKNQPQDGTTELFWPFTKSQSAEDKAKAALESAKSSLSNAGSTVESKAKSAYDSAKTDAEKLSQKASDAAKTVADKAKTAAEDAKNAYNTGKAAANTVQNQPQDETTELFWPFTKSQSAEDKAKAALESAKSSLSSAGSTVETKAKSTYDSAKSSAEELSQKASETAKSVADKAKTAAEDAKNAYNTGKAAANTVQNQPQAETTELFWPFTKSQTAEEKAKAALESAKSSLSSAGSTVETKAKSAYDSAKTDAEKLSQQASETAKSIADKAKTAAEDAKNAYNTGKTVANAAQNQDTTASAK